MHKFFITGLLAATVLSPVVAEAAPGARGEGRGNVRAEGNFRGQGNLERAPRAERRNAAPPPQQTAPIARPQQSRPVYAPPPASNVARRDGPQGDFNRGDRAPRSQAAPVQQTQNRWQNRDRRPVVTQPTQSTTRGINNRYDRNNDGRLDRTWDRNRDGQVDRRFDRNGNGVVDRNFDRNRNGELDRRYDRNNDNRLDRRYAYNRADRDNRQYYDNRYNRDNRWHSDNRYRWNRDWRNDRRYDWYGYRNQYRNHYRLGRYYAPYRDYSYRRFDIGFYLGSAFLGSNYWINDPYYYRLPAAYDGTRWIRYYDDVLLVDLYTGEVLDVIHNFFW